jgi:hypothetical protein
MITQADAAAAFRNYLDLADFYRSLRPAVLKDELDALPTLTTDGQTPLTMASYAATGLRPPRYSWGRPTFLVPRFERFPVWFTAVVERKPLDGGERRTAVLTLVKRGEKSDWRLSFASLLYPGTTMSDVALDKDGYASIVDPDDQNVAITPQLIAPLHATVAEEGPSGFASKLIAAGPHTTGYSADVAQKQTKLKTEGLNYDSIFSATDWPVYALRTRDGGAIMQYALTWLTKKTSKVSATELVKKPIPADLLWAVPEGYWLRELRITQTHQYVTRVPAKTAGTLTTVIGYDGETTKVGTLPS